MSVFELSDKKLRQLVFNSMVTNVDTLMKTKQFFQMETEFIAKLGKMIFNESEDKARRVVKMLMRIFYKGIWNSKKLINLLARGIELKD